jgi:hypothetical protein
MRAAANDLDVRERYSHRFLQMHDVEVVFVAVSQDNSENLSSI